MVRLGCIEDYAARVLPRALAGFWAAHPDVNIEVDIGESAELLNKLGNEYDMVLVMHAMPVTSGTLLRTDRLVWTTSSIHSPHGLDPIPVALRPDGCLETEWATAALDAAPRPWRCAFVSAGVATLLGAVEEGMAVGVFKESTLPGRLRRLTPADGFPEFPPIGISLHVAPASAARPDVILLFDALVENLKPL